jgi:hypothetical protein
MNPAWAEFRTATSPGAGGAPVAGGGGDGCERLRALGHNNSLSRRLWSEPSYMLGISDIPDAGPLAECYKEGLKTRPDQTWGETAGEIALVPPIVLASPFIAGAAVATAAATAVLAAGAAVSAGVFAFGVGNTAVSAVVAPVLIAGPAGAAAVKSAAAAAAPLAMQAGKFALAEGKDVLQEAAVEAATDVLTGQVEPNPLALPADLAAVAPAPRPLSVADGGDDGDKPDDPVGMAEPPPPPPPVYEPVYGPALAQTAPLGELSEIARPEEPPVNPVNPVGGGGIFKGKARGARKFAGRELKGARTAIGKEARGVAREVGAEVRVGLVGQLKDFFLWPFRALFGAPEPAGVVGAGAGIGGLSMGWLLLVVVVLVAVMFALPRPLVQKYFIVPVATPVLALALRVLGRSEE